MVASLACRLLKIPRSGYFDIFGLVVPNSLARSVLKISAGLNECFEIAFKGKTSEAGSRPESLALTFSLKGDRPDIIASLSLSPERVRELLEPGRDVKVEGAASVASVRKLSGKLHFAQSGNRQIR